MSQNHHAKGDASPPGAVLAEAREELNLSIAEVARHLKLSPAQVEALEEGEYDRLPGRVFVRGFLRNYAKLLGVDPEPLLKRIDNEMPQPPVVDEPPPAPHEVMPTGERSRWPLYAGIASVIIVALAAYEFGFNAPPPSESDKEGPTAQGGTPAGDAPTAQPDATTATSPQTAETAGSSDATTPPVPNASEASASEASAAAPVAAATETAKAADAHELQFRFEEESWVEVRDANDKAILKKLIRAGSEERVTGTPPFKLVIGNARGVRLSYDGEAVDLAPHTGATVARLTLK